MAVSDISPDTRVYLSWGTGEVRGLKNRDQEDWSSAAYRCNYQVSQYLEGLGASARLRCQVGGNHCEADWEKLVPEFMHYLWME